MCDKPCPCEACKRRRNESFEDVRKAPTRKLSSISCQCEEMIKDCDNIGQHRISSAWPGLSTQQARGANVNMPSKERYGADIRAAERPSLSMQQQVITRYNNATATSFGVGNEAGVFYFLKETMGIVGFCVLTTVCLWALIMKFGINLLSKINHSDKHVRNFVLLAVLIISLVIFQGMLLRKVKTISLIRKNAVKIKPQKSKIVVAQSTITKRYWYPTWKSGVTNMWIRCKESGYKLKVRVVQLWPIRSKSSLSVRSRGSLWVARKQTTKKTNAKVNGLLRWPSGMWSHKKLQQKRGSQPRRCFWRACKANTQKTKTKGWSFGSRFHFNIRRNRGLQPKRSFWSACKENIYKVSGLFRWPFRTRSQCKIQQKPSFWSSCLETAYKIRATLKSALTWPFFGTSSSSRTCSKKRVEHSNWRFWPMCNSSERVGSSPKGWSSIKEIFTAPPHIEDPVAREVMRKSKLYAIPTEMKRPPQLLVYLRDYFQQ